MNGCWRLWQKCCSMCIAIYSFPSKSSSVWLWPRSYPPPWPIFPPKKLQKDKEHCLFIQFPPPKGINQAGCHVLGHLRYILGCMIHRLCLCHTSQCFCTSCPMKGSRNKTCLKGRMYTQTALEIKVKYVPLWVGVCALPYWTFLASQDALEVMYVSQSVHYWLRWSIGFWNVQKVDKSRQLFLIQ